MTSPARSSSESAQLQALASLREKYLAQGFTFDETPTHAPSFLGSYRPDAIARKPGLNVAIELRQRRSQAADMSLQEIRRRFDGQPGWKFVVEYLGDDPHRGLTIAASSLADVRKRLAHVRALQASGELVSAFILGWSLLEAVLNNVERSAGARPRTPGTVIQTLAMLGYVTPDVERKLRSLITLRNRIVHGDLAVEPAAVDVETIIGAVEGVLSAVADY